MEPQLRPELRVDKLLWFLRFAKSRTRAQAIVAAGHIRLNGRRVERGSACVRPGDVISLPIGEAVRVIRVVALPARRGPPAEAGSCYEEI
ncbi:RNA-binding S4 domain-containing protein [Novosphingopyxis sp.]|uniref:RNA-binding S4 domain-containing protein n=1 Tax=Novosphingopyxis sp. TaxID=2709690 RepID=UPI003B5C4CEA